MYAPVVKSAKAKKRYRCGSYEAAFLEQIVAEGRIGYEFIIVVFQQGATDPFLFVTSERNALPMSGKSHYLCLFDKEGHYTLRDSDDWGDAEKFETAALEILAKKLGATPVVV